MASKFKAQCLALLDQVARTKVPLIVTKHGKPVARVVPPDEPRPHRSTDNSVTILTDDEEELFASGIVWDPPDLPEP